MERTFNIKYSKHYDPNKPDLIFCDLLRRVNINNLFTVRFMLNTAEILSKDFNIFWFLQVKGESTVKEVIEEYDMINYIFLNDQFKFDKKVENENFLEDNHNRVLKVVKEELDKEIKNVKGIFIKPSFASKTNNNELFDCISNDEEQLKISEEEIQNVNKMIKKRVMYSYNMYSTRTTRILMDTIEYFAKRDNAKIYQLIIDPSTYYVYYNREFNAKSYYFEDDFRGNRELYEFPIGPLNYFYNYKVENVPEFRDKKNAFIWGGVVLIAKNHDSGRLADWLRLLKDFNYERSVIHVSKSSSIKVTKNHKFPRVLLEHPLFEETVNSIENHPINEGFIPNLEFEEKLKDYRYTLILKCASINDSINFRIYYSLIYNMIPLIDKDYDIDYIQIPKKFKDQLLVYDHKSLIEKIDYFENNIDEAEKLLNELKEYYMKEDYFKREYYEKVFREKYFKEIYE